MSRRAWELAEADNRVTSGVEYVGRALHELSLFDEYQIPIRDDTARRLHDADEALHRLLDAVSYDECVIHAELWEATHGKKAGE